MIVKYMKKGVIMENGGNGEKILKKSNGVLRRQKRKVLGGNSDD